MGYEYRGALIVVPLIPAHLRAIVPQLTQRGKITPNIGDLVPHGTAWTVFADTEIIFCGGVVPIWEGRGYAWSILTERAGLHFVALHRVVRFYLDNLSFRRIEATVDADFLAGHRWMRLLGFSFEGVLHAYNPDGSDAVLYARIR